MYRFWAVLAGGSARRPEQGLARQISVGQRNNAPGSAVKNGILVISALADKATGIEALEKGARGFLCKPFTDEQLNEALRELVED